MPTPDWNLRRGYAGAASTREDNRGHGNAARSKPRTAFDGHSPWGKNAADVASNHGPG